MLNLHPKSFNERQQMIVPGDTQETLMYCVEQFISLAKEAIQDHGAFFVALSGGSTPKAIFEYLTSESYAHQIEWNKIHLFWSDERAAPPDHPDNNYHMAMQAGLKKMPIPKEHIHRMRAEEKIEENALSYEQEIKTTLKDHPFDLMMLGMGEDGHTASLFPHTEGLKIHNRLVIANYIPEKKTWRMSLTYDCINQAKNIVIYVLGASKKATLANIFLSPPQFEHYPIQKVGTSSHPALWIMDKAAAQELLEKEILPL